MDESRARSFGAVAAAYAAHRPGYAEPAVAWALELVSPGGTVLDLGAGTGKLTTQLLAHRSVVAVEPDPAMRAELQARLPATPAHEGSAESIPLPDASVDAVVAGQAFHWFDPATAMPEISRVLRPGGVLAALWNGDDDTVEWVRGYHRAGGWDSATPWSSGERPSLPAHDNFTRPEYKAFRHGVRTTVDGLLATLATHSWALTSPPEQRAAILARIGAYLGSRPETAGEFTLPVVTEVVRALRR